MVFKLYINTDNDAFQPRPEREVAAILRHIAKRLESADESGHFPDGGWTGHYQTIFDANGNDVGRFAIKREDES